MLHNKFFTVNNIINYNKNTVEKLYFIGAEI